MNDDEFNAFIETLPDDEFDAATAATYSGFRAKAEYAAVIFLAIAANYGAVIAALRFIRVTFDPPKWILVAAVILGVASFYLLPLLWFSPFSSWWHRRKFLQNLAKIRG